MQVPFKILNDKATIPTQGSERSAGYDLYSINEQPVIIPPYETVIFDTGLAFAFPENTFGAIYPRSGIAIKKGLRLANSVAVIDSDYRGAVKVVLYNDSDKEQIIEPKERIAQLILTPYLSCQFNKVDELPRTNRGEGGFGSTGQF